MRTSDWVLLAACVLLALAGPAMAWQEWTRAQEARTTEALTGDAPPLDAGFRAAWRLPLLALLFVVSALGAFSLAATGMDAAVRPLSGRLVALLVLGMLVAGGGYVVDGLLLDEASHALRAVTLVWLYPVGAVLVAGSAHRLAEVREHFSKEGA